LDQSTVSVSRSVRGGDVHPSAFTAFSSSLTAQVPFAPDVDWPLAPAVERAIMCALREAVSVGMSIAELTEQLNHVLRRFEIELPADDVRSIVGAHVMGAA